MIVPFSPIVVAAEGERGDDAEVAAAAAQRPEQVAGATSALARDERAVGEDDVGREQVVDGQAEAAGQVADAAAEGRARRRRWRRGCRTGVARPNAWVAWSTSPQVRRASTRTVRSSGSTVVLRIGDRSMTSAPSQTPSPRRVVSAAADGERRGRARGRTERRRSRRRRRGSGRSRPAACRSWRCRRRGPRRSRRRPGSIRSPRRTAASSSYGTAVRGHGVGVWPLLAWNLRYWKFAPKCS